jgi:hypothetical protein
METPSESGAHIVGFTMCMDGTRTVQIPMQPIEWHTACLVDHSARQGTTSLWSQYHDHRRNENH